MKYYIIAGEASGDLHGANLIDEIKKKDLEAEFRVWGGDKMSAASNNLVMHYRDHAVMGFSAVLINIRRILKNIKYCYSDISNYQPDVLILIDYPGFNLKIAEYAHKQGFKVYYYISPKVWIWNKKRVYKIKAFVDKMFTILPFEKEFYKQYDYEVDYVGNPLLDAVTRKMDEGSSKEKFREENGLSNKPIIALLAGSRKDEIKYLLPEMLAVSKQYTEYQFVIAGAPSISDDLYSTYTQGYNVNIVKDKTYDLLKNAAIALVTSGTATLETALFEVPQVVCYKTSPASFFIGTKILRINVKYFSLVNIIMDSTVVKELLQYNLAEDMNTELNRIINDKEYRSLMRENYKLLKEKIGKTGASERTAKLIVESLR